MLCRKDKEKAILNWYIILNAFSYYFPYSNKFSPPVKYNIHYPIKLVVARFASIHMLSDWKIKIWSKIVIEVFIIWSAWNWFIELFRFAAWEMGMSKV
jgi:hypothetical protein